MHKAKNNMLFSHTVLTALLSICEPSLLSFPASRQFLISHNDGMSPVSVQFSSSLDFLHIMSSCLDVVFYFFYFFHTFITESER